MRTVVAITGASSGIGAAFARRLASGHNLILIARRKDKLETLAGELSRAHGTESEVMAADLTEDDSLARVAGRIASEQNLALLVNNAGFGTKGYFWKCPIEEQELMHKLHVMATVRLTHAALGNMVGRNFGAIINVASVSAFVRGPGSTSYSATKSWMTAFTEGLHLELRSAGLSVGVQALCPGFTYSEFHDRIALTRERLASPAFWLTAEEVVDASLEGLRKKKLFVIPGWRYRLLVGFLNAIPTGLRLAVESAASQRRRPQLAEPEKPAR
ncbi:MAG: SDR family oxidoreductase [Bryobacteraceae bacterium]